MTAAVDATALMNRMYRRQRHVYDLTRKHYLLGRDDLIAGLRPDVGDRVLELGCGTGRNLIAASTRYPGARFFGVDVSTEMLTSAIVRIERANLRRRIRVAHADATRSIPISLFGTNRFERIYISYALSMMPGWAATLDVALGHLAPRGELHVVDFGGQERMPRWVRGALRMWLAQFHVRPCDRLEQELRLRAGASEASLQVERPYRGYAQYAVFRAG